MPIYITEYERQPLDVQGNPLATGQEPALAEQLVAASGVSAQSAVFNSSTSFIMVHTTEIVCLAFGLNPTAVNNRHRMAANETRFYGVKGGNRLAVITGT